MYFWNTFHPILLHLPNIHGQLVVVAGNVKMLFSMPTTTSIEAGQTDVNLVIKLFFDEDLCK
jgi:hypothetical protein